MLLKRRVARALAPLLVLSAACSTAAPRDDTDRTPPRPDPTDLAPTSSAPPAEASASAQATIPAAPLGELDIDPSSFDFRGNPELTARIAETPHQYFRFINKTFATAVCKRLDALPKKFLEVRLHGDPHVEQYAVTDLGRGLTDFDDAAMGPQAIDLVRFGTSLILASRIRGFAPAEEDKLLAELYRGYADGLGGKALPSAPPAFAGLLAAKFKQDRSAFLASSEQSMQPLEPGDEAFLKDELAAYVAEASAAKEPKRPKGFYDVKKSGRVKLGIGSALVKKFLLRLEGPTLESDDDVMMEIKQVSDLSGVPCLSSIPGAAAGARGEEQARAKAKNMLLPLMLPDGKFWVNEWIANFQEAKIKKLEREADLEALAYEAGWYLTREHLVATSYDKASYAGKNDKVDPKRQQLAIDAARAAELGKISHELADATKAGWERFLREVATKK